MKSTFNWLLLILAVLDTIFLAMCIWDYSCLKVWGINLTIYVYMFPYLWYPGKNIILSWTTFLITGVATERFLAVCRLVTHWEIIPSKTSITWTFFLILSF